MYYGVFNNQFFACEDFDGRKAAWMVNDRDSGAGATVTQLDHHGGIARLAVTATDPAQAGLSSQEIFRPEYGDRIEINTMLRISQIADYGLFFGVANDDATNLIAENEDGTLFTAAGISDIAGLLVEGNQDSGSFKAVTKKDGVASALADLLPDPGVPTAAKWLRLGLSIFKSGTVQFRLGNTQVAEIANAIDPKDNYAAAVILDGRGTATNVDLDYIMWTAPRHLDFADGF